MDIDQNLQRFFNIGFNDIKVIIDCYETITNATDLYKFINNGHYYIDCHIGINTNLNEFKKYIAFLATIIKEYHIANKRIKIEIYFNDFEFILQHSNNIIENKIIFLMKWKDMSMISSNGFSYLEKSSIFENLIKINTIQDVGIK